MTTKKPKTNIPIADLPKPKKKDVPQDSPTRKSIADLLRRMRASNFRYATTYEISAVNDRIEARTKELLDADDELRDLYAKEKELRKARDKQCERRTKLLDRATAVFYAEGLTPKTTKLVNDLVKEFYPDDQGTSDEAIA